MVTKIKWLFVLGLLVGLMDFALTSHFRGGHISWEPVPNEPNKILVTWRLSWIMSTNYCDENSRELIGDSNHITCNACTPAATSAKFFCSDTNYREDWSTGVNKASFTVNGPNTTISYSGGSWIGGIINGGGSWNLVSHVGLTRRLDNNRTNSSPKTGQSPIVYIQQGCQLTINIPVVDVDGDVVRCRWADSNESGRLTLPDSNTFNLSEPNCRLTVSHHTETFIAIALSIEDFLPPYTQSSRRLSSVPLQFLVKVTNLYPQLACNQKPVFVSPTPEHDYVFDVLVGTTYNMTLRARAVDSTLPIVEFSSASSPGLSKSDLQDDDNGYKYITVQYTPTTNQNGTDLICFSAEDSRQSSEQRCVRFRVIADVTPPVISEVPSTQTVISDTDSSTSAAYWMPPAANDNTGKDVILTSNYDPGHRFSIGKTVVTYQAVDINGNTASSSFDIYVVDIESPRLLSGCPDFIKVFTNTLSMNVSWSTPNFTDNSGEFNISSNLSSPSILNVGSHNVMHVAMDPSGNSANCTVIIHVAASCHGSRELLVSRNFTWPLSEACDKNIESLEICGYHTKRNGTGIAIRVCQFDKAYGGSRWLDAKYVGCGEKEDYSTSLIDLSQTAVNDDNELFVAQATVNATADLLQNTTDDNIGELADTLSNIVEAGSDDPQVTVSVVKIVNNLVLAVDGDKSPEDEILQKENNADELLRILVDFEQQIERAASSGQDILPVVGNNIIFTTTIVSPETSSDVSFAITSDNSADDDEFGDVDVKKDVLDADTEMRTSISLPASIFQQSNTSIGVSFVVHRTDTLFPSNSTNETRIIGGDIISAIVTGATGLDNLSNPVVLQFSAQGANPSCVFWDFVGKDWSEAGCYVNDYSKSGVTCYCYHLTNFAVLLDSNHQGDSHMVLYVISRVGCGFSIFALLLTIGIHMKFRQLWRGRGPKITARKILFQFSVALCLLYSVFLVGIDQTQNSRWCAFFAALLQYLTLVTLMWMAVEAQNMYANLVRIFQPQSYQFFLRAAILAWGAPLVVTAISMTAGLSWYHHGNYCFVTSYPLHYGVILPVAMILLHNLVIFGMVIRVLLKAKEGTAFTKSKRLMNAVMVSVLLGITWLFGLFSIKDAKFVFSLIFCLLNSFQGVVILLFCFRQEDILNVLRPYYMKIWCVRVCLSKKRRVDPKCLHRATKKPYSHDHFTFQLANSTFDFAATTQTNPVTIMSEVESTPTNHVTIMSEVEPEMTIDKAEKETELKSIPATQMIVNNRKIRVDSKLNKENSDNSMERNEDSIAVDVVIKSRELDNISLNNDDARVPLDLEIDTDVEEKGIQQTDAMKIKFESESSPTRTNEEIKVKAHNTLDESQGKQQNQVKQKRRIFSITDIFVNDSREEQSDRNQMQNGGATKLDSLDDEFKETKIVGGGNEEGSNECLMDDEDMLVAPIEIENDIRDARIDVDED